MQRQKALLNVIYGYISLAVVAVTAEILGILRPLPGILAIIWLLIACWYIGRYGDDK